MKSEAEIRQAIANLDHVLPGCIEAANGTDRLNRMTSDALRWVLCESGTLAGKYLPALDAVLKASGRTTDPS